MRPPGEALDDVGEARAPFREVGRVDLGDVPEADDLRPRTRAGDEGLHLLGREVLRFVDDDELLEERAPAHEAHRLDADAVADEVHRGLAAPVAGAVRLVEDLEVVFQSPHPRRHLLFFRAGEVPDVFAHAHRGARDDDLREAPLVDRLRQGGRERQERLPGAGLPEERHEVDLGVHEEVEGHVLLGVSRLDAPDLVLRAEVFQEAQLHRSAFDRGDDRGEGVVPFDRDALVDVPLRGLVRLERVAGGAAVVPALEPTLHLVPEGGGEFRAARVHHVGVVEDLVVEVVLGGDPQRGRLDAHVDVFAHEHDRVPGEGFHGTSDGG